MTGHIEIEGARENNLADVSLTVPRNQITVFTGVSGSGKSSIVFDTIAAEAQRQLNETFSAFAQSRLPKHGQPDVDAIQGLSAPVIIDQKRLGGGSRSTVGTITDINARLRMLFSRAGEPSAGYSSAYSFNDPQGMCPRCDGIGKVVAPNVEKFVDRTKSLNEGALLGPGLGVGQWAWGVYVSSGLFDNDKKLADYSDDEWQALLYGNEDVGPIEQQSNGGPVKFKYEGVIERFTRLYINRDTSEHSERTKAAVNRFVTVTICPRCAGTRLAEATRNSRIDGCNIADVAALEVTDLMDVLAKWRKRLTALDNLVDELQRRVGALVDIGLGYLSLDRETTSLSGGESQRIKMVRHLSSSLTEMLYVLDEPSIGLHTRDVHRMCDLLVKLRDKGNTVLVVEHDRDVIEIADHVVDMGPGAGTHGGRLVYQGDVAGLAGTATLTGEHLARQQPLKGEPRRPQGTMTVTGATTHNLRDITVDIPTGVLTVVTGVAGSGKSTLVHRELLPSYPDAIVVDQSPIGASRRSNPATYTGMMDIIRKLFARANQVSPSLFSFNSAGACPNCQGQGVIFVDLAFMDGLKSVCDVCLGRRFNDEVLALTYQGRSIADVLELTAEEAVELLTEPRLTQTLTALNDVGLGYLKLGQPLSTLSGGESQRVKLATELRKTGSVYIIDEPTVGLHMADVQWLLGVFDRLVDRGNTVVVIEHHLDVIKRADWVIDLGPEGGDQGGGVLFTGTPRELLDCERSFTAQALRRDLGGSSTGTPRPIGHRPWRPGSPQSQVPACAPRR